MTSRSLIILGATGDLTSRLLLPALDGVLAQVEADDRDLELELIGAGHDADSAAVWHTAMTESLGTGDCRDAVRASSRFEVVDATSADDLRRVIGSAAHTPILYFALPPAITEQAIEALSSVELPEGTRLALEKPFARDAKSAAALNGRLSDLAPESRIHRIDHFLGKSTVINLLGLRFANRIFEAIWGAEHIEHIEIVYDEQLALEGRAGYYDRAGALVDMIQSHLLL
ncbi:MAG: glucose-6-phosphate dehydrogenase, partial [Microcella sp.]|nr:glucose-6-phosphate dehydrogenase [Microcella sp.]